MCISDPSVVHGCHSQKRFHSFSAILARSSSCAACTFIMLAWLFIRVVGVKSACLLVNTPPHPRSSRDTHVRILILHRVSVDPVPAPYRIDYHGGAGAVGLEAHGIGGQVFLHRSLFAQLLGL